MSKKIYPILFAIGCIIAFVLLHQIFAGNLILPQSFILGPITIHYYGIVMAAAAAAGFYLALKRAAEYRINSKEAEDLIFWLIIGGFVGARLYHVLSLFGYYSAHPAEIIQVWNGGLSIYGAIIGGFLTLGLHQRLSTKHLALSTLLDWLTPSLLIGQIIGRFGNLFNYEAFGYPTSLPWKMFVPPQFRPFDYHQFNFFHPFFLYEAAGNAIILFLILKIIKPKAPGCLFFSYLLLYNILRFALEFLRLDSTFAYGIRINAVISLLLLPISISALLYLKNYAQKP